MHTVKNDKMNNMRCDRCGNSAYFVARKNKLELFFCRRHYLKNELALKQWTSDIDGKEDMPLADHINNK